jgi:hypothetical protein
MFTELPIEIPTLIARLVGNSDDGLADVGPV